MMYEVFLICIGYLAEVDELVFYKNESIWTMARYAQGWPSDKDWMEKYNK